MQKHKKYRLPTQCRIFGFYDTLLCQNFHIETSWSLTYLDLANAVSKTITFYLCMKMSPAKKLSRKRGKTSSAKMWFQDKLFMKVSREKSWWANMLTKAWWTQRLWEPCWLPRVGPLMELALCFQCTWTCTCNLLVLTLELYSPF